MWGIIINPKSGKKALRKQLNYLSRILAERQIAHEQYFTKYAGHATEIARELVESGIRKILILGGDGTFSEIINGIFSAKNVDTQEITLALIPRGTGNDWGRFWNLTRNYKDSIHVFLEGKRQMIDVGVAEYYRNRELQRHYFINSIGFGLDHRVVHETHRLKYYLGSHAGLYFWALLKAVFTFRSQTMTIQTAENEYTGPIFTINIGNGPYSGGGMKQNPAAIPTDGFFDAMFVFKPSFKDVLKAIPLLFNGKLTQLPIVKTLHTPRIDILTDDYLPFEADGIEEHAQGPYSIRVLPLAVGMIG